VAAVSGRNVSLRLQEVRAKMCVGCHVKCLFVVVVFVVVVVIIGILVRHFLTPQYWT